MWYNSIDKEKPIYITLTEEHLENIDKTITIRLIRSCNILIRHYNSENLELETKINHLEKKTDFYELMKERHVTHTSFYEHTLYDSIKFFEDIRESIIEYGSVSVNVKYAEFENTDKSQEELDSELEKLEQEKNKYSKRHTELITEYQTKLTEKREIYVTDPISSPKETRPPPPLNKNEIGYRGPNYGVDSTVGVIILVGILLAITIGFMFTMGN